MSLLQDYKTGKRIGVHVDEPICNANQRKNFRRMRDEFFSEVEESPYFCDQAPHLQHLADKEGIFLPFQYYTKLDADAGKGRQLDSDCFSWSTRFMIDTNRVAENVYNKTPKQYIESSATCLVYGSRGHCGKGMTVYDVRRGMDKGILLEKEYKIAGRDYDFTSYPDYYKLGVSSWCRSGPPEDLLRETRKFKIGGYAIASSMEEIDAGLVSGRNWSCGSSIGVSSQRDDNGVSALRGSWAHAMAIIGKLWVDWVKQRYRQALYLWDQSWGNWNRGVYPNWAKELGVILPEGFFLLTRDDTWKAVKARQTITYTGISGFPDLKLQNFGSTGRI